MSKILFKDTRNGVSLAKNMQGGGRKTKFTDMQKRFADEYLVDLCATHAAIRAGFSPKTANEKSVALMKLPHIKEYIESKKAKIEAKLELSQTWVIERLKRISDFNSESIQVPMGAGEKSIINDKMRDAAAANKSTELIGKHLGMFTEKVELTGKDGAELFVRTPETELELARQLAAILSSPKLTKK